MTDYRNKRRYQSRKRARLRKRRRRRMMLLILTALLFILIAVCAGIFWKLGRKEDSGEASEEVAEEEKRILELKGEKEITYMAGSVYQEAGTSREDAVINGEPDLETAGTYTIEYTWEDQTVSRTVHVVDDRQVIYSVQNGEGIRCSRKRTVHVVDEASFQKNTSGIPVLMYHFVYTDDDKPGELNTNYILNTRLEEQLQYLKEQQYYFPSYQELSAYVKGEIDLPEKSVVLTFDDGQQGFLNYGIPLLEKYEIPATSFAIASESWDSKIKEYASEYVSFQSHSYNMHRAGGTIGHGGIISAMSREEILQDLQTAQDILFHTEAFAYPYGDVTEDAKTAVAEAGILCTFTTEYGRVNPGADPAELSRVRVLGDASLEGFIGSVS